VIKTFRNLTEAAKEVKLKGTTNLSACCLGRFKSCMGFRWHYLSSIVPIDEDKVQYKKLDEYPGYRFFKDGRVWNEPRKFWMKVWTNEKCYPKISIKNWENKVKTHTIICEAFYGPKPSSNYTVDHLNRDIQNWNASNLRWATRKEQRANQRARLRGIKTSQTRRVNKFDLITGKFIETYINITEAARQCNGSTGVILELL